MAHSIAAVAHFHRRFVAEPGTIWPAMRRFHLVELHEQSWFPETWRWHFQALLGRAGLFFGLFAGVVTPLAGFLERLRPTRGLDLCAGSGELALDVWQRAAAACDPPLETTLVLSDLYPPIAFYQDLRDSAPGLVDFEPAPLDAHAVPEDAPKVWTIFESLHHFPPPEARRFLAQAAAKADGVAIFESTERSVRRLVQVALSVPFLAAHMTLFHLPFAWHRLFWGVFVPVLPLVATFDSLVSNLRSYTVAELEAMTREAAREAGGDDFQWEVGTVEIPKSGGQRSTYVFGWRTSALRASS